MLPPFRERAAEQRRIFGKWKQSHRVCCARRQVCDYLQESPILKQDVQQHSLVQSSSLPLCIIEIHQITHSQGTYIARVLLFKSVEQSKKRGEALQDLASETLFTWTYAITFFSAKPTNASPVPMSSSEEGSGVVAPERENAALNGP
jgi:hypothetical protein